MEYSHSIHGTHSCIALQAEGPGHDTSAFCTGSLRLMASPRWHMELTAGCTEPASSADETGNDTESGVVTSHWAAVGLHCGSSIHQPRQVGGREKHLGELVVT